MIPAQAATFQQAAVVRLVDGREVFIDGREAKPRDVARAGQQLRTGRSRAEVLFDNRSTGFVGKSSVITLGNTCFRLNKGSVLVNGPEKSCLGTKVLGVKGTTYILSVDDSGFYDFVVLEGQGYVGPSDGYEEKNESPSGASVAKAGDPSGSTSYVCSCEVARFNANGEFVSQGKLDRTQYLALLRRHADGHTTLRSQASIEEAFSKCYSG